MVRSESAIEEIELIVGAFILDAGGRLLLISGDKWNSVFVVPGGHVEPGEPLERALLREVEEETGLAVRVERLLGVQESIDSAFAPRRHMIFFDYLCAASATVVTPSMEAQRHRWIEVGDLERLAIGDFTRGGIERYRIFS